MITEIGIVAGEVWHVLDKKEEIFISEIADKLKESRELVFMSMGWLAREGHVVLKKENGDYKVSLR